VYGLSMNAIRLSDLSVREYQSGRNALRDFHNEPTKVLISPVVLATGHFETCLWAVERTLKHVKAIRSCLFAPTDMKDLLPKGLVLLRGTEESMLTDMRHSLAHLERDILEGKDIPETTNLCLMAEGKGLRLGSLTVPFEHLADWIRELHGCAERLASYKQAGA